jgi:parvulin-like peptidyl-prolyl isomerase
VVILARKLASRNNKISSSRASTAAGAGKASAFKIIAFILLILVGLGAIFAALGSMAPNILGGASLSGKLAAKVNGEEITMKQLDAGYFRLTEQQKLLITKEDYLDQLIEQALLRQEAKRLGTSITDYEAEQNVRDFMQEAGIDETSLQQILNSSNLTYKELVEISRNQLLMQRVLALEILPNVQVTEEDALEFYNSNAASFKMPEVIVLRHILFSTYLNNRTLAEADTLAGEVLKKIASDKNNFCDLAQEYSDDLNSLPACGEYNFPKGSLPDEFEVWAQNTNIGELGIVSSTYGTHVLWLVNKSTESKANFDDVKKQIITALKRQEEQFAYEEYINGLRSKATIQFYLPGANGVGDDNITPKRLAEGDEKTDGSARREIAGQEVVGNKEVAASEAKESPASQGTGKVALTVQSNDQPIECLASKKAVLYGADWDSSTAAQLSLLGDLARKLTYVECSVPGDYSMQAQACKDANIEAYPTWIVEGKQHLGIYTAKQLADAAGCK